MIFLLKDCKIIINSFILSSFRKEYLIKPTNIPSPGWIRTSFKSFIRIYEIEIPQNELFTKNIIERTFLDCGLPRKLEETCFRLYTLISLIRKDHQFKSIDEVFSFFLLNNLITSKSGFNNNSSDLGDIKIILWI